MINYQDIATYDARTILLTTKFASDIIKVELVTTLNTFKAIKNNLVVDISYCSHETVWFWVIANMCSWLLYIFDKYGDIVHAFQSNQ